MSTITEQILPHLEATGQPYSIQTGGRHKKVFIGARMIGIFPVKDRFEGATRAHKNLIAQIRRAGAESRHAAPQRACTS